MFQSEESSVSYFSKAAVAGSKKVVYKTCLNDAVLKPIYYLGQVFSFKHATQIRKHGLLIL